MACTWLAPVKTSTMSASRTSESLLPGLDNTSKLYDVRVDGGFPYTTASQGCEQGQCELPARVVAVLGQPATEALAGPGDAKSASGRSGRSSAASARKRRLARALRLCRRRMRGRRRVACERAARRRYGANRAEAGRGARTGATERVVGGAR